MASKYGTNLDTFTVAGYDVKNELASDISLKGTNSEIDASVLTQEFMRTLPGQGELTFDFTCYSAYSSGDCANKITSQHVSVFTLNGNSYINSLLNTKLTLNMKRSDQESAFNDQFKASQNLKGDITIDVTALVSTAASHTLFNTFASAGSSQAVTWSATINGTTITVPCNLMEMDYTVSESDTNRINLKLRGYPACTGDFPTSPSASGTLVTDFLVDPFSAVVVKFKSASSNAETVQVNALLQNLEIDLVKNQTIQTKYSLVSTGTPALTLS